MCPKQSPPSTPSCGTSADSGPTEQEVAESKQYLIGSVPRTLETNMGIATYLQTAEFFGLGLDYDVRMPDLLRAVTREQIHEAARRAINPDRALRSSSPDPSKDLCREPPPRVCRVLRRRFHVDLSGADVSGRGLRRILRTIRNDGRSRHAFSEAVRVASSILDAAQDHAYDADIFVCYTRRIIEEMGGSGPRLDECATEIYNEWAACQHFFLYDDVAPVLQELAGRGLKIGLISNSHRCLASFQEHFQLQGLITAAVSSSEHGYMKPHPSIFEAALSLAGVDARDSVMVGDSIAHDIDGASACRHARGAGAPFERSCPVGRRPRDQVDGGAPRADQLKRDQRVRYGRRISAPST